MLFAIVAPFIPSTAYQRYPTISGFFRQPVDPEYIQKGCLVHTVDQAGDYYAQCPYTAHPLFSWSPIIALSGLVVASIGVRILGSKQSSLETKATLILESLAGIEGIWISFVSLFGQAVFESFLGLLGYPLGFFLVIDGLRRLKVGKTALILASVAILIFSGIIFFYALLAAVVLSEYP